MNLSDYIRDLMTHHPSSHRFAYPADSSVYRIRNKVCEDLRKADISEKQIKSYGKNINRAPAPTLQLIQNSCQEHVNSLIDKWLKRC